MLSSTLAGLGLGLSLIVAIGAQNLFVLRQGVRREHVLVVALVCALSDAALIVAGVSGIGLVLEAVPWLIDAVRWAGAAFLAGYAALAARRAWRPAGVLAARDDLAEPAPVVTAVAVGGSAAGPAAIPAGLARSEGRSARLPVLLTCLALTWLNPHVYLDTVFLLGSVASAHGDERWWFAAGAMLASAAWFFSLAYGARVLGRWLATPRAWRMLDGAIALVMVALAVSLVWPR